MVNIEIRIDVPDNVSIVAGLVQGETHTKGINM